MVTNCESAFSLEGKNILITGASSGIGRACAIECSKAGANLFLIARDIERLKETKLSLPFGNHVIRSFDLNKTEEIDAIVTEYVKEKGPFSGMIYSAGVENTIPLQFSKSETYVDMFRINVLAAFEIAKSVSKKTNYDPKQGVSFVFISSVMGFLGQEGKTAYSGTKGALIAGSKSMALELARKSIRVNTISPAIVETEMSAKMFSTLPEDFRQKMKDAHPLGLGKPEDIANACIYLLSDASKWVTGTNLIVDGGYSAK